MRPSKSPALSPYAVWHSCCTVSRHRRARRSFQTFWATTRLPLALSLREPESAEISDAAGWGRLSSVLTDTVLTSHVRRLRQMSYRGSRGEVPLT